MSKTKSDASPQTYINHLQNGNIKSATMKILKYVKDNPKCNLSTIRTETGISHQTVTGSISNMMDLGLIKFVGKVEIKKSVQSQLEYVSDLLELYNLIEQRKNEKIYRWANYGMERFLSSLTPEAQNCLIGLKNLNTIADKDAIEEKDNF